MLEYNRNSSKGENMEIAPYRLTEEMYEAIDSHFKEARDRQIIIFCLEQSLGNQSQVVIDTVNRKINHIIFEVKEELIKHFATKTDLELVRAILEKQIAELAIEFEKKFSELKQDIAEVKLELKQDIAEVKDELKDMIKSTQMQVESLAISVNTMQKGLDDKINSFKYSIIKWLVLTAAGIVTLVGTIEGIFKFAHF